ncbi:hypothetical protein VIBHAR_06543 [Vibrio campbellii ATCC BAA-1116]|uniref:Uncharacterized protein n=1 Tax=Vibrio campbellii (strain ATCC BAA-1116) TaxID=2902295 RepID=A7N4T4_VIBC1|nr:hypothetical protein VIBHAR_06543 [Vibrio campbellii ATCC BAA-1116]
MTLVSSQRQPCCSICQPIYGLAFLCLLIEDGALKLGIE